MENEKVIDFYIHNKKYIFIISAIVSLIFLIIGVVNYTYNIALIGVLILYASAILYNIDNLKSKIYYLLFYGVIFVFILSRPTIAMLRGQIWWYFSTEDINWSLIIIYISIIGLFIGGLIGEKFLHKKVQKCNNATQKNFIQKNIDIIRKITFIMFIICFIANMTVQIDKMIFMNGKDYVEYYTTYNNSLPTVITTLSNMMIVFMIFYLITKPNKKISIICLMMYIITTVPMLIIGERGSIVKAIIFAILYIWYRNCTEEKKWINKREKVIVVILIPISIIGLGIYNYTRSSEKIPTYNPITIIVDFFYKQGVTFDVLNIGHGALEKLPDRENKNYTFGGIIDYVKYNSITCKIFNVEPLPSGNNEIRATQSNSFAHAMSYVAKDDYLEGHRMGIFILVRNLR